METTQKPIHQLNNFKITSQYFIQQLDTLIVQLVKTFAIEHSINPDPDAKEIVRQILLTRAHNLMSENSEKFTKTFVENIKTLVKTSSSSQVWYLTIYELLKLMGLDNVNN